MIQKFESWCWRKMRANETSFLRPVYAQLFVWALRYKIWARS